MNCKQAEKLLPLYAGSDLDKKRARIVSEHLQVCAACTAVAAEYQGAFQLTQQFAAPVFSDDVYASVRGRVLREIESQPTNPALPQLVANWFRPRVTWAVATGFAIAVALSAFYFIANRKPNQPPVARTPETVNPSVPKTTVPKESVSPRSPSTAGGKQGLPSKRRTPQNFGRLPVIAKLKSAPLPKNTLPFVREAEALPVSDSSAPARPLRVEIQTKDPNIRIIWFSQPNVKPVLPQSKGI